MRIVCIFFLSIPCARALGVQLERDTKKKPVMSPKEKKAAKQAKKDTRDILGN